MQYRKLRGFCHCFVYQHKFVGTVKRFIFVFNMSLSTVLGLLVLFDINLVFILAAIAILSLH